MWLAQVIEFGLWLKYIWHLKARTSLSNWFLCPLEFSAVWSDDLLWMMTLMLNFRLLLLEILSTYDYWVFDFFAKSHRHIYLREYPGWSLMLFQIYLLWALNKPVLQSFPGIINTVVVSYFENGEGRMYSMFSTHTVSKYVTKYQVQTGQLMVFFMMKQNLITEK